VQEHQYPIIDNINDNAVGIEYYVQAEAMRSGQDPKSFWARLGIKADRFGQFLRFAVLRTSWRQFASGLGGDRPPEWDVAGIRQTNDVRLLLALIPDDATYGEAAQLAAQSPDGMGLSWKDFSDGEIRDLCTAQASRGLASNRTDRRMCPVKGGAALGGGDPRSLGAATTMLFSTPELALRRYLKTRQAQLAARIPGWDGKFRTYVFSHTHRVQRGFKVIDQGNWQPVSVNTGAWQRVASPAYIETRKSGNDATYEVLKLQPDKLAPCYSVIEILPGHEDRPAVLFWRLDGGNWEFDDSCPADPGLLKSGS